MNTHLKPVVILMAEDDADDRLLAEDALKECDTTSDLHCVENGEELLDYLLRRGTFGDPSQAPSPGLILLDLNMPRKGGVEALQEIKAHPELRKIPVVVFTTSRADADICRIYQLGANSFITKPVTYQQLVNLMRVLCQYWLQCVLLPERV
jgi:CheY-like chemotaxis protein